MSTRRRDLEEVKELLTNALAETDATKKKSLLANARETLKHSPHDRPESVIRREVEITIREIDTRPMSETDYDIGVLEGQVERALNSDAISGGRRKKTARRRKRSHRKTRSRK